ncbi:NADH-quinone oxidoreductase subunit NuoE [Nonomuraea sp. NPDC046570]|uniref:NADH-quinone oxidoreductase subunit NuoE n=1 Tax=Nonomuraea sp. NPDC046570 TaxID=3155255 RepID=UPI0033F13B28
MSYSPEVRERLERDAKEIIGRYPKTRSALLPLLHLVQSEDGYITDSGQEFCAEMLGLNKAEVVGVATFYTMYKRKPVGEYHVGVCINSLCAVMGGDQIWEELSEHVGVGHDEATADGKVSLERLECNAACDFAPVMMVNWEFFDNQTPDSAKQLVDDLRDGKPVSPTRGPEKLCSFKQASRVLSGLPDELAGEGPSAAGPSLEGLKVAKANGWKAPEA